jgi:lipopolysaccharide transport system permease protein
MEAFHHSVQLVSHLVRRDFHLRYTGSILGVLWSVLLPLTQLFVLVFVFQRVVPLGIEAYPAFVFSTILPWTWFSSCLAGAGSLFISNRDLMRRPNFVPAILILVNMLSNLLIYMVSLPLLFGLLFWYGRQITWAILVLPLLLLVQSTLIIGLSLILATLNVFYRDIQHIIGVGLSLLFYLTPVFYHPGQAGKSYQILFIVNPMAVLVESYRMILFYGEVPQWDRLLLASVMGVCICALGYLIYSREQHRVMDAI